jgi:hypothetical protein
MNRSPSRGERDSLPVREGRRREPSRGAGGGRSRSRSRSPRRHRRSRSPRGRSRSRSPRRHRSRSPRRRSRSPARRRRSRSSSRRRRRAGGSGGGGGGGGGGSRARSSESPGDSAPRVGGAAATRAPVASLERAALGSGTEEVVRGLLAVMPHLREDLLGMLDALDDGHSIDVAEVSDTFECA